MNHQSQILLPIINDYYERASNLAIKAIEHEARELLKNNSDLKEYVQAMGSGFFINNNHEIIDDEQMNELDEFFEMLWDLNDKFNVLGYPMRFTTEGKIITDW
jgi:hypothetical protein